MTFLRTNVSLNEFFYLVLWNCIDQYYYSFLLNPHEKMVKNKDSSLFPVNVFLKQINPSIYEPHYQVVFKDELWHALPVIILVNK